MSVDSGKQDLLGYPRFGEQDLAYPDLLLLRLRDARDPVSEYLRKRCDPDMARLIEAFDRLPPEAEVKWKVLVNELNRLLEDPDLFDEDRFAQVKLRYETQELLAPKLNYEELLRRNRLLLEDAYPQEIERSAHDFLTPEVPTPTSVETMSSTSQPGLHPKAEQPNPESNGLNNPFPGLRPFETNEYHLFFGRDGQSDELIERLGRTHFLAVVGTSGSGKSSLVRAGLLPALYGGLMAQAGSAWRVALFRPGDNPLGELATALGAIEVLGVAGADLVEIAMIETTLRRSALGLIDAVRQARLDDHESVLVVVDQFEELFRFKEAKKGPEDDATAFVKLLLEAGAQRELPIYVVITMRSDYLGDCAQFRNLPEAINLGQYLIPRMTRDERREAITGPVAVAGGEMTVPLINLLLNDVGDNPDQLPILQHALMRSWNHWKLHKRNGQPLDIEDYEAVGGMERSLSNHANEAYRELGDRKQKIAAKVFKALTEKGIDNREIRRPTPLRELCAVADASEEEVISVIETFRGGDRCFLMPPEDVTLDADTIIDISHESLIRNWSVLERWVGEEAESARMYRRLADAAKAFGGSYLPDSLLDSALDWRERNQPNAAWAERYCSADQAEVVFEEVKAFIDTSRDARVARIKDEERLRNEEIVRQRRELEQAAALAEKERRLAETERERAEERSAAQQRELEQAQLYASQQAHAAQRLRRFTFALVLISLLALAAAGGAAYAYTRARASENRTLLLAGDLDASRRSVESARAEVVRQQKVAQSAQTRADHKERKALEEERKALDAKADAEKAAKIAETAEGRAKSALVELSTATKNDLLNRDALAYFQRGNTETAETEFKYLTQIYADDPAKLAWAKSHMGEARRQLGNLDDGIKDLMEAQEIQRKLMLEFPREKVDPQYEYRDTITWLAQAHRDKGEYALAEPLYLEALKFHRSADNLEKLARNYTNQGQFAEAAKLYKEALNLRRSKPWSRDLTAALKEVAEFQLGELDNRKAAIALYEEALGSQETLKPDDRNIAVTFNELARVYNEGGFQKRAERLNDLARIIRASSLIRGDSDEKVFMLQKLAKMYIDDGRPHRASPLLERASRIIGNIHGRESQEAVKSYIRVGDFNLEVAKVWMPSQNYLVAGMHYQQALGISRQKGFADEELHALDGFARLQLEQKKFADAEALYKQVLGIRERKPRNRRPDVELVYNLEGLADSATGLRKYAEAEVHLLRALKLFEGVDDITIMQLGGLGGEGLDFYLLRASVSAGLAEAYRGQNRLKEADEHYRPLVGQLKKTRRYHLVNAPNSKRYLDILEGAALFYSERGDAAAAEAFYRLLWPREVDPKMNFLEPWTDDEYKISVIALVPVSSAARLIRIFESYARLLTEAGRKRDAAMVVAWGIGTLQKRIDAEEIPRR